VKRRYKKRKKWQGFKKIKLSRDGKNAILLLGGPFVLMISAMISDNDIFLKFALAISLTAPILIARHIYSEENKRKNLYPFFLYAYAVTVWLFCFLPWGKISYLFSIVYFAACGIYLVYEAHRAITESESSFDFDSLLDICFLSIAEIIMLLLCILFPVTTERNALGIILAVLGGVAVSAAIFYFLLWKLKMGVWKKIGYCIIVLVVACLFCLRTVEKFNWALDFSEPKEVSTMIKGKDHYSGKGGASYTFTAYIGGKLVEFEVDSDVYEEYNPGDKITVNVYNGALGMDYYKLKD